jgi:hypothetical protein
MSQLSAYRAVHRVFEIDQTPSERDIVIDIEQTHREIKKSEAPRLTGAFCG